MKRKQTDRDALKATLDEIKVIHAAMFISPCLELCPRIVKATKRLARRIERQLEAKP